ncbi:uncharacterized protein HD556DRAFT_1314292 [Suillus plorans]|uniref:Uncharacterized protein n=1 Tax=Suillus plorans TaxID=116603 RepID=A0A9P7AAC8_9AGAM|nr:uncharacterized protein HD556DRAFT_1314292 [Suillus plorans]KAG1785349.1 hypothetical protein HD556DRAFT_1314292 [Suillus plorans]
MRDKEVLVVARRPDTASEIARRVKNPKPWSISSVDKVLSTNTSVVKYLRRRPEQSGTELVKTSVKCEPWGEPRGRGLVCLPLSEETRYLPIQESTDRWMA